MKTISIFLVLILGGCGANKTSVNFFVLDNGLECIGMKLRGETPECNWEKFNDERNYLCFPEDPET